MHTNTGWKPGRAALGAAMLALSLAAALSAVDSSDHPGNASTSGPADTNPAPARPSAVRPRRVEAGLKVGHHAPDVELRRLGGFRANADGTTTAEISDETVRLSSFESHRPVCLIFSSYT